MLKKAALAIVTSGPPVIRLSRAMRISKEKREKKIRVSFKAKVGRLIPRDQKRKNAERNSGQEADRCAHSLVTKGGKMF